jgi:hypothetical protein
MKIIKLNSDGIQNSFAKRFHGKDGGMYYGIEHGENGTSRWCIRLPLSVYDFPVPEIGKIIKMDNYTWECSQGHVGSVIQINNNSRMHLKIGYDCIKCLEQKQYLSLNGFEFKMRVLNKKDHKGNNLYFISKGEDDGTYFVLWNLSPGYKGKASFSFEGNARLLATAYEAQEINGEIISTPCPIMHVFGDCVLHWERTGKVYGDVRKFSAEFKNNKWSVK